MKKWMMLLLAAIMVFTSTAALAEDGLKAVDEIAYVVTDSANGRALIYVFIEVENTSDEPLALGYQSKFTVIDQKGKEYSDGTFMSLYPQSLDPGEKGYVIPSTYSLTNLKSHEDVADYRYELVGGKPSYFYCAKYDASIEIIDDKPYVKVSTPTNDTLYNPSMGVVFRGDNGELLHVETNYLYDYGIPAGMSVYVDMTPRKEVRDFFATNGLTLNPAECFAYVTTY